MDEVVRTVEDGVTARGKLRRPGSPSSTCRRSTRPATPPAAELRLRRGDRARRRRDRAPRHDAEGRGDLGAHRPHRPLRPLDGHTPDQGQPLGRVRRRRNRRGPVPGGRRNGSADHIYLADRTRRRSGTRCSSRCAHRRSPTPGVAEALYRKPNPLDGGRSHTSARRPRAGVGGQRSGDLFLTAEPGSAFSGAGSQLEPTGREPRRVADARQLPGRGRRLRSSTRARSPATGARQRPVNVDVAPTVMRLFGMHPPADSRGRVLRAAFQPHALSR